MAYFGEGTSALTNEYLRTQEPLTYAHFSKLITPIENGGNATFFSIASTQSEKTIEVLSTYKNLLTNMPIDSNKLANVRFKTINDLKNDVSHFRERNDMVAFWQWIGYESDPRGDVYNIVKDITTEDIIDFHQKHIKNGETIYGVVGNLSGLKKQLKEFGVLQKIKTTEFLTK